MGTLDQVTQPRRERSARRVGKQFGVRSFTPFLYIAPFLIFFIIFQIYPIFYGLYISLTKWDLVSAPKFTGLTNYINLGKDTLFWTSLRNTVFFVGLNAPLAVAIPLGLAILVSDAI